MGRPPQAEDSDDGNDWISSPLWRMGPMRVFVVVAPLAMVVALLLSFWAAGAPQSHSLAVFTETRWQPGERLGLRVNVLTEVGAEVPVNPEVVAHIEQRHQRWSVPKFSGTVGSFVVPEGMARGAATLVLEVSAPEVSALSAALPVTLEEPRSRVQPEVVPPGTVAGATDTSDDQPEGLRIVARPCGRLITGFDNEVFVRVTDVMGTPWRGPVMIRLVSGEFMGRTAGRGPAVELLRGTTDRLGLVHLSGMLLSDTLRIEVVAGPGDGIGPTWERQIRLASYPGAVGMHLTPEAIGHGLPLEFALDRLVADVDIEVDVFAPDGGFADAMVIPREDQGASWSWSAPATWSPGIGQFQARRVGASSGPTTATARFQMTDEDPFVSAALIPLIDHVDRTAQDLRFERGYEPDLERQWLLELRHASLLPHEVDTARRWLLGTLPVAVFNDRVVFESRSANADALAMHRRRWNLWLRVYLIGGGAAFILAMLVTMVVIHRRSVTTLTHELRSLSDSDDDYDRDHAQLVASARRRLMHGMLVVLVMALALVLTFYVMESFTAR